MKRLSILLILFLAVSHLFAQKVYLYSGWSSSRLEKSFVFTPQGTHISISRDFTLFQSNWKLINHVDNAFLFSELNSDFSPGYINLLGISPKISYEFKIFNSLKILPFLGPFGSWEVGLRNDVVPGSNDIVDDFHYGFDMGLAIDVPIKDNFSMRLIPWRLQYGNNYYRHGLIQLGISL